MFHYKEWLQNQVRFDKISSIENLKSFLQLQKKDIYIKIHFDCMLSLEIFSFFNTLQLSYSTVVYPVE